jgi:hypothetical protein
MASLLSIVLLPLASSGCLFIHTDPPHDTHGDIAFDWSFAGEAQCANAGVDTVKVDVLQDGELIDEINEPCVGGGLTLTDFLEGIYDVDVTALDPSANIVFHGAFTIHVIGGQSNNAGVITLDAVNPPPPPTGTTQFFWSFLYPTDSNVVTDCTTAGADSVTVSLTPLFAGGATFQQAFACSAGGVVVDSLVPGSYTLDLSATGTYHGASVPLYTSTATVVVTDGNTTDLGDLHMNRVDNFADFQVSWDFVNATCVSEGVSSVHLAFTRLGETQPEDALDIACDTVSVERRTFVPGSYTVTVTGTGTNASFVGAATVDAAPTTLNDVTVQLAPSP